MGIIDDPISGVLGAFFKRALDSKIWKRIELGIELWFASSLSFLFVCGSSLMARLGVSWSIGAGMVAAAVALLATFQVSPNSKGLTIAVQRDEVVKEAETSTETITGGKQ